MSLVCLCVVLGWGVAMTGECVLFICLAICSPEYWAFQAGMKALLVFSSYTIEALADFGVLAMVRRQARMCNRWRLVIPDFVAPNASHIQVVLSIIMLAATVRTPPFYTAGCNGFKIILDVSLLWASLVALLVTSVRVRALRACWIVR